MNLESGLQATAYAGVEPGSPGSRSPHSPVQARDFIDLRENSEMFRGAKIGAKVCFGISVMAACATVCFVVLAFGQASSSNTNDGVLSVRMPLLPWQTSTTTTTTLTTTTATVTATSTTITTSTTSRTATSTSTSTTYPYPSLFCFSVMRSHGYELSLIRTQLSKGVSIFACEAWSVFSDKKTWLSPGPPVRIESSVLNTSLVAKTGQIEHLLNTEIFIAAFEQIHADARFKIHDFIVKVDPDAVFLPHRLKTRILTHAPERDSTLYFTNCKASFQLYGALEVFSRKALEKYFAGASLCKSNLPWKQWGEDMFMRKCMDFLHVPHKDDFGLLTDAYCGATPSPCDSGGVAFHPFKSPDIYMHCMAQADSDFSVSKE